MKRFTETTKWADPWFRRMKPLYKVFMVFLWDNCDSAGVWVVDMELAAVYVGASINPSDALKAFDGRVIQFQRDKWLIPKFVAFQYGKLSSDCFPHKKVMEVIDRHGLRFDEATKTTLPTRVVTTQQEEDKEKEKELQERGAGEGVLVLPGIEPELDLSEFADEIFALYPRKEGKSDALKAIREAFKIIPPLELRAKVSAYALAVSSWVISDRRYVPWCQKWMNKKRWLDDPETWYRPPPYEPTCPNNHRAERESREMPEVVRSRIIDPSKEVC